MKLGTIPDPFAGEKIAEIYPKIAPFVEQTPRLGRLNLFPGRHLTDVALGLEQAVRVKRLALRGRAVTHGVVNGLELTWRLASGGVQFQLQPGQALTKAGIDVVVDRTIEFAYEDLRLYDPTLDQASELPLGLAEDAPTSGYAAVLLLQPGHVEDADLPLAAQHEDDGTDFTPCPRVPEDEVYYKTTTTDAARLILYPLPWDEPPGDFWRNRVAWSIFDREAAGTSLPWHEVGVPLAVIGFNDSLVPEWIDRQAVVRPAGRPRQRVLIQPTFDARVWIARFEQFCAHLSETPALSSADTLFQSLPPIGVLPKRYLKLEYPLGADGKPTGWVMTQRFFPNGYTVDVSVVPLEQLDALLDDTVRLQPYDLSHLDGVRLLLPVSQQWFDPDLLKVEKIDPLFDRHIEAYRKTRGDWLAARYDLANRRRKLELSAGATPTDYPLSNADADPKRLELPEDPVGAPPGEPLQYGVMRSGTASAPTYASELFRELREDAMKFLKQFTAEDIAEFKQLLSACGVTTTQISTAFAPSSAPAWLANFSATANDATLDANERDELRRELLAYIKKQTEVQTTEEIKLKTSNLQELITFFEENTNKTDDIVDSGFLKARTDVFRLGTLLSNNSLATKFAASPSLANIVDRKPPKTDTAGVNNFASQLLANFAPSAAGTATANVAASAAGSSGTSGTPMFTLRAMNFGSSAGSNFGSNVGSSGGASGTAGLLLSALGETGKTMDDNKSLLDSAADKLSGSERDAFNKLREAATNLTSSGALSGLGDIVNVSRFADTFIPNFNLLSQKQIRAIPLDRLQPALAPTIRREIHDGRLEIFERLARLDISLGDLTTDFVDAPGVPVRPALPVAITRIRFQTLLSRRRFETLATITQTSSTTGEVNDADESRHFSSGVSYADMAMSALRAVEARIKEYRAFIERCRGVLKKTQDAIAGITTALTPVELELEEARQDVAVALALKAEEEARLKAINDRRRRVVNEQVEFLVFHRPRAVTLNRDVPARKLEPALQTEPVIECLRENPTPPADLAALRDVFRASPAKWFKYAPKWLATVDRWEQLRDLIDRATRVTLPTFDTLPTLSSGRYTATLTRVFESRRATAQKFQATVPVFNAAALSALSWIDLRQQAERQLTLGHLIAAGPAPLAKAASGELEDIFAVATCLHENFSAVPGLIRLEWAERFGQFDNVTLDFRDLSRLPGWPRITFTLRREMQRHVDWIFGRIDTTQPDALDLINDLVRVALLLASHAPVDQLIVGHPVEAEVNPRLGGLIKLQVDPLRIRLGMNVTYKVSETQFMRAVVEDISASQVSARVLEVPTTSTPLKLTANSTLYFKAPTH